MVQIDAFHFVLVAGYLDEAAKVLSANNNDICFIKTRFLNSKK